MQWIDANDLRQWGAKPNSKAGLPELISRLIRATTNNITDLQFPTGNRTYRGGWDGILIHKNETEFLPEGISLWECGTETNVEGKANKEYEKRTNNPLDQDPAQSTFVFVTPQVWEKKEEWIQTKLAEGKWKDVKVYDADKLVQWLSIAPVQSLRLANQIGKLLADGITTAIDFWEDWSTGNEYNLPPKIVTTGREKIAEKLSEQLADNPTLIPIKATTKDEAIAFYIANALQSDINVQETILAKSVIVEDAKSFRQLTTTYSALYVIAKFEASGGFYNATTKGHFIVLPLGADDAVNETATLQLPKPSLDGFIYALENIGMSHGRARILSKECGRSITILRRREGFGSNSKPAWAKPETGIELLPALLMGRWDEAMEGDRILLSQLANDSYENYVLKLAKWKIIADAPIYQIGTKWRLASPLDAWFYLGQFLTKTHFDILKDTFLNAARQVKPALELEPDKRWMASLYGKGFTYSRWSREGITQSLILIAVFGHTFELTNQTSQLWVDGIIHTLFEGMSEDLWCSLSELLPLLAEASPTSFMNGVEKSLSNENAEIMSLFTESNSGFFPSSHQADLLWALEGIAWLPLYLTRCSIILAKLAERDPGGRTSNRPINSLQTIFSAWLPQTLATQEQRIDGLKMLQRSMPAIAWNLCGNLLPNNHRSISPTYAFRWRVTINQEQQYVDNTEQEKFYSTIVRMLVDMAVDNEQILHLVQDLPSLSTVDRQMVISFLQERVASIHDNDGIIWNGIREVLHRHRSLLPGTQHGLSKEEFAALDTLYEQLSPDSTVDKILWIFRDHWPKFPDGKPRDIPYEEQVNLVRSRRNTALQQLESELGLSGILDLASSLNPYALGDSIGYLALNHQQLEDIFHRLNTGTENEQQILSFILQRVYYSNGMDGIIGFYNYLHSQGATSTTLAELLIPIPCSDELLSFIDTVPVASRDLYWRRVKPWFGHLAKSKMNYGIETLIRYGRYFTALDQAAYHKEDIGSNLLVEALEKAAMDKATDTIQLDYHWITYLLEELDGRTDVQTEKLAALEMMYLPLLTAIGSARKPNLLHQEISKNPLSFVEILKWVYKPEDENLLTTENAGLSQEQIRDRAYSGRELLESWKRIPGIDEEGNIDFALLSTWIAEVRKMASDVGRLYHADAKIGQILAYKREDSNSWPGDEICAIIDKVNSNSLNIHFHTGIKNKNGSTVRWPFDGGAIEHSRQAYYGGLSNIHASKWPVTSKILENISKEYESMAIEEDNRAQQDESDY